MTLDLAQAAALHARAVAAGMEGIIPPPRRIICGHFGGWQLQHAVFTDDRMKMWQAVEKQTATAAVMHWLREFNKKHTDIHEMHDHDDPNGLIALADRIITQQEARNANPA